MPRDRDRDAREERLAVLLAPLDELLAADPEARDPERGGSGRVYGDEVCAVADRTRGGEA